MQPNVHCSIVYNSQDTGMDKDVLCLVTQLYLTLCDPIDCSPPGSSVHEILQARILEWVAMFSSRGSSPSRNGSCGLLHLLHWQAGSLLLEFNYSTHSLLFSLRKEMEKNVKKKCRKSMQGNDKGSGNPRHPRFWSSHL